MLSQETITLVKSSYKAVTDARPELFEDFYTRLFVIAPEVRDLFPNRPREQAVKLEAMLQLALSSLDAPEALTPLLHKLGFAHVAYGVQEKHYIVVGEVLLDTLAAQAGDLWTAEVSAAWFAVVNFIASSMIDGARAMAA
ncbi:globin domain-containing protein [Celeribacter sp.]|uniref:globin domain-containing protein n=1 Tax=Celeribacter sp. TaxID=1890673 RepID=UPI003A8D5880